MKLGSIDRARLMNKIDELEAHIDSISDQEATTSVKKIRGLWDNFDHLCMALSRIEGKMSFTEIKSLSVYDFHKLKDFLKKITAPKNALDKND